MAANRREALWESGLQTRPSGSRPNRPFAVDRRPGAPARRLHRPGEDDGASTEPWGCIPRATSWSSSGRTLDPRRASHCRSGDARKEDEVVTVAGWPVARQHPRGRDGTVFVTIEDETGDTQVIVYADLFARRRRELGSQVIVVTGRVSLWDGTVNVVATDLRAVNSGVKMPPSHDWH